MIYTFQLSTEEKALIVQALRERAGEAGGPVREELARRIDYTGGEEDGLEAASRMMRNWYGERVHGLAEDVLRAILDGEVSDLGDYLHETVDSTDLVIYTWKASAVLFASDNEDAGEQELGEAPDSVGGRAYWALRADVLEALESMVTYGPPEGIDLPEGFELHDSDTWTGTTDEDADEATETAQADEVKP